MGKPEAEQQEEDIIACFISLSLFVRDHAQKTSVSLQMSCSVPDLAHSDPSTYISKSILNRDSTLFLGCPGCFFITDSWLCLSHSFVWHFLRNQ